MNTTDASGLANTSGSADASGLADVSGIDARSNGDVGGKDVSSGAGSGGVGIGHRFAEPKPIGIPPKVYRIGEIVEHSGLSRQTIHNYTTMGLLVEARRSAGGHRLYDESVFERLNGIIVLKAQHKSLAYIREYYAKLDAG
ncbi:MAG: MerR family transcriptional regulator [bacterium]|nr:MerR family transcriptional regulator [bacterium]